MNDTNNFWKDEHRLSESHTHCLRTSMKGVLHIDFLHEHSTYNAVYCWQLLDEAKFAYQRKRCKFLIGNMILLLDIVCPHTAKSWRNVIGNPPDLFTCLGY